MSSCVLVTNLVLTTARESPLGIVGEGSAHNKCCSFNFSRSNFNDFVYYAFSSNKAKTSRKEYNVASPIQNIYTLYNPMKLRIFSLIYSALFGLFINGYVNTSLF